MAASVSLDDSGGGVPSDMGTRPDAHGSQPDGAHGRDPPRPQTPRMSRAVVFLSLLVAVAACGALAVSQHARMALLLPLLLGPVVPGAHIAPHMGLEEKLHFFIAHDDEDCDAHTGVLGQGSTRGAASVSKSDLDACHSKVTRRFRLPDSAAAPEAAVVLHGRMRFQVLDRMVIRMELCRYNTLEGCFVDWPSNTFLHRNGTPPVFNATRTGDGGCELTISTDVITLHYNACADVSPSASTLRATIAHPDLPGEAFHWHWDKAPSKNLGGTYRTLDRVNGPSPIEPGILSEEGWSTVDDTGSFLFDPATGWPHTRPGLQFTRDKRGLAYVNNDLYLFGFGRDYQGALNAYAKLSGRVPMIPRFILGNWWSRWWDYTEEEVYNLVGQFETHGIPLNVFIVDMDWHVTETGRHDNEGWTGYTWSRQHFPDPPRFIAEMHHRGLRVALNLHPASGCWPHEEMYDAMATWMGIDPASRTPVAFNFTDPRFIQGYFDLMHHPHEDIGIDFWWIDWQHGMLSDMPGADPLFLLNHYHFLDTQRPRKSGSMPAYSDPRARKRPFVFSRWAGLGGHRYPIGFSGDTIVTWQSMSFQPYFTATSANVLFGWWSHDIGGFMQGHEDPELFVRWVQFGSWSPIFRLHSIKSDWVDRRPWSWDATTLQHTAFAMQHRQRLVPYLYTMAWRNTRENLALVRPMYHAHPHDPLAYCMHNQYFFGSQLLVAPFVTKAQPTTRLARQVVWLPEHSDWFDFFTGERMPGDRIHTVYGDVGRMPVFARAGAIVPLAGLAGEWSAGSPLPPALEVVVFPGANGEFQLFEDDGESTAYLHGHYALTPMKVVWDAGSLVQSMTFAVLPAVVSGTVPDLPAQRLYTVRIMGVVDGLDPVVRINGSTTHDINVAYEQDALVVSVAVPVAPTDTLEVVLAQKDIMRPVPRARSHLKDLLKGMDMPTQLKITYDQYRRSMSDMLVLNITDYHKARRIDEMVPSAEQERLLVEHFARAGVLVQTNTGTEAQVIFWNHNQDGAYTYVMGDGPPAPIPQRGCVRLPGGVPRAVKVDYYGRRTWVEESP